MSASYQGRTFCKAKGCAKNIIDDVLFRCDECKEWFCGGHSDWYGRAFPHKHRLCDKCSGLTIHHTEAKHDSR